MPPRKATVRLDRTTRTWTVTRPRHGFTKDEVRPGFTSQHAALQWLQGNRGADCGSSATITEIAYVQHDGVSPAPWWSPLGHRGPEKAKHGQ